MTHDTTTAAHEDHPVPDPDRSARRPGDASYEVTVDLDPGEAPGTVGDPIPDVPQQPRPLPERPDDRLDGFETSMARFARRFRGWLAALLAVALIIPLGGWLIDEIAFRVSGDRVEERVDHEVVDAVLLVRSVTCAGTVITGSAFVAEVGGETVVVTNRHVVAGTRSVGIRHLDGGPLTSASGIRLATGADVGVIEVADPTSLPAPLVLGTPPIVGQEVRLVGFPAALPFTTAGTVAATGGGEVLLDLRTDPGASGSPVVDSDDRVVAQVFARTREGQGVATSVDALARAVETAGPASSC